MAATTASSDDRPPRDDHYPCTAPRPTSLSAQVNYRRTAGSAHVRSEAPPDFDRPEKPRWSVVNGYITSTGQQAGAQRHRAEPHSGDEARPTLSRRQTRTDRCGTTLLALDLR